MRVLLQRVSQASVTVDGTVIGRIGRGYCLLVGITHDDGQAEAAWLAHKIVGLRIFEDDDGKMNRALSDVDGAILAVSQFTLYGDTRKGRRPSFIHAARPEHAEPLFDYFVSSLRQLGVTVETGAFGAMMDVEIHNDGPVTLMLEKGRGESERGEDRG
jgi:D-tyrosyl-tRNA(Tyr) deacylase